MTPEQEARIKAAIKAMVGRMLHAPGCMIHVCETCDCVNEELIIEVCAALNDLL